jgi:hypothetical protein
LLDEVAARVGAALNSAVLFERQARGRAALDTLQQFSGRIAAAATSGKIVHAALSYGSSGLGADGGVLFMLSDDGDLVVSEAMGASSESTRQAELDVAAQSVEKGSVVVSEFDGEPVIRMALSIPLRILNRTSGVSRLHVQRLSRVLAGEPVDAGHPRVRDVQVHWSAHLCTNATATSR